MVFLVINCKYRLNIFIVNIYVDLIYLIYDKYRLN